MKKEKWIWMPHAAHFILGDKCGFKLATYVGKYIVSTVGELWLERSSREVHAKVCGWSSDKIGDAWDNEYFKKFGYEKIGCDRIYETMVFKVSKYKDKVSCCPYRINAAECVDSLGYNDAGEATKGHMNLCNKWSKK